MNATSTTGTPRKRRIFLIDDHPLVREGLANLINGQHDLLVCGEAEDSPGAMTGIAKTRPDAALVDISLKNESGLELVKNLDSQFPLVALIVLSMHDEALYAERALRAGARTHYSANCRGFAFEFENCPSLLRAREGKIRRQLSGRTAPCCNSLGRCN